MLPDPFLSFAMCRRVLTTIEKSGFSGYRTAIASVGTRRRRGVEINA
jgi:hypothetical protein